MTILLFAFYMVAEAPKMLRLILSFFSADRASASCCRIWEVSIEKDRRDTSIRGMILAVLSAVVTALVLASSLGPLSGGPGSLGRTDLPVPARDRNLRRGSAAGIHRPV